MTPLTETQITDAIEGGMCPWCPAGPFKILAVHVNKIHDIDRMKFRELLGVRPKTSICDPEVSEKMSVHAKVQAPLKWKDDGALRTELDSRLDVIGQRTEAMFKRYKEGLTMKEIAVEFGVHYHTVRNFFRSSGLVKDARLRGSPGSKINR